MTPLLKQMARKVTVGHIVAVVLLLLVPLVRQVFNRPRPVEELTFVDLADMGGGGAPAAGATEQAPTPPEPKPAPEPEPEPEPEPTIPEAKPLPEPKTEPAPVPKTEPKPVEKQKIKISTNKVVRAKSPAPPANNSKPAMSAADIKKMLASGIPASSGGASGGYAGGTGGSGSASVEAAYQARVRAAFYEAWDQPSSLSNPNLSVVASVRISKDGTVTSRRVSRPSGNSVMDSSVNAAIQRVSKLPAPPRELGGGPLDINVAFELGSQF